MKKKFKERIMKATNATVDARNKSEFITLEDHREVSDFLYMEARLADESRYAEWEALIEDDMTYWVPRGEGDYDMNKCVSITADNRTRVHTRIAQLMTGKRHAQLPVSRMRRLISNIEIERHPRGDYRVLSNFVLYELRLASTGRIEIWPGQIEHHLRRRADGSLGIFFKKVSLIQNDKAIPSMAFII
jgi:3-phenylpropionate/cinnamic acid dioxygenase small subunit